MSGSGSAVTVVIPVWDRYVGYLTEAVESVRRNAPQAPIVVVDNASSAPVPELERCEVLRLQRRVSEGMARNLGLERVTTEYVVFLDADDMLMDGTLAPLYERIAADPGLAVSATSILDSETGKRHRNPRRFVLRLVRLPRAFAIANSTWSLLPIQGCAILRTDQVRAAGGYADADVGEDWDLAVSVTWRGRVEISERLGRYYRSTAGSAGRRERSSKTLWMISRRIRERLRLDPGVPGWVRSLIPAIAVAQFALIYLVRPVYLRVRILLHRWRANTR